MTDKGSLIVISAPSGTGKGAILNEFNQKYFVRQQKHLGEINGYIEEKYSAHNLLFFIQLRRYN